MIAGVELAIARLCVATQNVDDLVGSPPGKPGFPATDNRNRTIDRIAFAIPRMGARVPWRSTCLVQAIAAQRWLRRSGISSSIKLGARRQGGEGLDAHAWLEADGRLVVGGEVAGYTPFTRSRSD